ncbi:MAG: 3-isopropylmalate dehydratase small subunit [Cellvibrionaceae bacterium]|nr:3-isopropylmalate dehydratase small subunit [Cellvibrionaceae bacterium]
MQAFKSHQGLVIPLDRCNVDTDALLPKQYLKCVKKFGYGSWLFDDDRYLDPGDVYTDCNLRRTNPRFALNQPQYRGASILLAQDNFGCGSSREHAVWALRDFGIRVVIAPSFADIFYNNCFKNGLLPLVLARPAVAELFALEQQAAPLMLNIDLQSQTLSRGSAESWHFAIDAGRKENLIEGRDDIAVTLDAAESIKHFENQLYREEPWLKTDIR